MKKVCTLLAFLCCLTAYGQNLTQADFAGVTVPQYMGSGTATRLPYVYRATVSNLTPNATYRYTNQAAISTDLGTTNSGAGNPMYIEGATFTYATATDLLTLGRYGQFTTNAAGSYTGWFAFVNTGNARFTAGNVVFPSITLNNGAGGTAVVKRLALDQTITVLALATTSGANDGTGIRGTSNGAAKDIVALYDNTGATGRPLSVTYIENEASGGATVASLAPYYVSSVDGVDGAWGTIVPNANANGVKAIRRFALSDAAIMATNTDADGTWPSGANTVNPTGGTTAIVISTTDATLPMELSAFEVAAKNNATLLTWQTVSEKNNALFNIERSNDGQSFQKIGQIKAVGNGQATQNYQFTDATPLAGVNYYRLQQVDFDGKTALSAVKSIAYSNKTGNWFLTNSLAKDEIVLSNAQNTEGSFEVVIFDMTGRQVQRLTQWGVGSVEINVAHLQTGHHVVRIGNETLRFFKQ